MLLQLFFPLPTGQVLLLANYLELPPFFVTKYSKVRVINFDLFSSFDKKSLKSQVVHDLSKLMMMMRFDLP